MNSLRNSGGYRANSPFGMAPTICCKAVKRALHGHFRPSVTRKYLCVSLACLCVYTNFARVFKAACGFPQLALPHKTNVT